MAPTTIVGSSAGSANDLIAFAGLERRREREGVPRLESIDRPPLEDVATAVLEIGHHEAGRLLRESTLEAFEILLCTDSNSGVVALSGLLLVVRLEVERLKRFWFLRFFRFWFCVCPIVSVLSSE
ncbi:hypothetical protein [Haloterrigena salifodinae]|uniref:hypothetical protein n=1 Tax=Haloterrigena salifodinae TaxID=2675099 RepID=UPI000F886BAD|nr:hypothetical protein [Haloterrigena salifodinae]